MTQSPLINVISKASSRAAGRLMRDFGEVEHLQISRKGIADFVSTADKDAERTIHEELSKARPGLGIYHGRERGYCPMKARMLRFGL